MLRKLIPLATITVFGFAGSTLAQETAQSNPAAGAGNAHVAEAMTCADLNEMEPDLAVAFLSGYKYAVTAGGRASATGAQTGSGAASSEAAASGAEVGTATTTGDVARTAAADNGEKAILDSCFDAPSTTLDEVLSGAYGSLD